MVCVSGVTRVCAVLNDNFPKKVIVSRRTKHRLQNAISIDWLGLNCRRRRQSTLVSSVCRPLDTNTTTNNATHNVERTNSEIDRRLCGRVWLRRRRVWSTSASSVCHDVGCERIGQNEDDETMTTTTVNTPRESIRIQTDSVLAHLSWSVVSSSSSSASVSPSVCAAACSFAASKRAFARSLRACVNEWLRGFFG